MTVPTAFSDQPVLEEAFTTLAIFIQSLSPAATGILIPVAQSVAARLEGTFASDSAYAARQRTAIAHAIKGLARRPDIDFMTFANPILCLLFRSWVSDDPAPEILTAIAAIFHSCHPDSPVPNATVLGLEALRTGNRHVVCAGGQLIAQVMHNHHNLVLEQIPEMLDLACQHLVNFDSDSIIVAAILDMISSILNPSNEVRIEVSQVIFPAREIIMELFGSLLPLLGTLIPVGDSVAVTFRGLLRGYTGMALLYAVGEREEEPGQFLAAYRQVFEWLPKFGIDLGLLHNEQVILAFLEYLHAVIMTFGRTNQFNLGIHRIHFLNYLKAAGESNNPL